MIPPSRDQNNNIIVLSPDLDSGGLLSSKEPQSAAEILKRLQFLG